MPDKVWRRCQSGHKADTWRLQGGHKAHTWRTHGGQGLVARLVQTQGGHEADTWDTWRRTRFRGKADTSRTHAGQGLEARPRRTRGRNVARAYRGQPFFLRENLTVNRLGKKIPLKRPLKNCLGKKKTLKIPLKIPLRNHPNHNPRLEARGLPQTSVRQRQ